MGVTSRAEVAIKKSIAQESNQCSIRKLYTVEIRQLLDESIRIKATVKIPSEVRRLKVTKGNKKKAFSSK